MKRDTLKWILVAAVVVAAAAYLYFSERKPNEKQGRRKARSEQVAIAEGHSKAFKIEPVEGITISAPENALDKDREFKLTIASEKQWNHDAKVVAEHFGADPFLVFDLDAGMKSDDVLPGTYTVQMDLNKMGIPKNLWTDVRAYRVAGSDCYQYQSRVSNDGILTFESNQNSGVALVILAANIAWQSFGYSLFLALGKAVHDAFVKSDIRSYFKDKDNVMVVPIDDPPYGSFRLYFRWSDTQAGKAGKKAFEENEEKAMARLEELEDEAEVEYERRINKMATGRENLSWWERIENKAKRDEAREKLEKTSVLKELIGQDSILRRLNAEPASQLPVEVEKNIDQIKIANQYLSSVEKLKPLTYSIAIYLMDRTAMGTSDGLNTTPMVGRCYVKVNMESGMLKGVWSNTPAHSQSALLTIVHELYHSRQQSNYTFVKAMKMLPAESTAAVLESDAARWFYKTGRINNQRIVSVDIDGPDGSSVQLTGRDKQFLFAIPLDKISAKVDAAGAEAGADLSYTLADLIEAVRKAAGKENVGMVRFCEEYKASRPFSELIKKALDVDDATLEKGWNLMIHNNIGIITSKQINVQTTKDSDNKECWIQEHTFTESSPILKIKAEKAKYYAKSWYFYFKDCPGHPNILILPTKEGSSNPKIQFYLKNKDFEDGKETPRMYAEDKTYLMFMSVADMDLSGEKEDYEYNVVALFPPGKPNIRRVKDDQVSFVMPRPNRSLTKNGLITGAVVSYVDKSGDTLTHNVDPKYFGKKVKWTVSGASKEGNGFSLSLHWYYKPDPNTTYVSPESEAAVWGAKDDKKKEEPTANQKKPETNYWKQVASRGRIASTSIEDEKSTGDEVSSDYRSIAMKMAKSGNVVEFTGMAATEEKTSEGRTYVKDIYLEGEITYTEPPTEWVAGTEYKGVWEVEDDPYLMRIKEPFEFVATVTSSAEKACTQSRREKTDTGRSKEGGVQWLRNYTSTYMARHPEKEDPKAFTLTQTFTIAERPGSSLKATLIFEYDYEWVGEPEEEVEEEPDGSYWKLVHTEVDDSHASFNDQWGTTSKVSGGTGSYSVHSEWWNDHQGNMKYELKGVCDRNIRFDAPKSIYRPGEVLGLKCTMNQVQLKGEKPYGFFFPVASEGEYTMDENVDGVYLDQSYHPREAQEEKQAFSETTQSVPEHTGKWLDGMKICEVVVGTHCWIVTTYYYEWVEGGQKPKQENVSGSHWRLSNTVVSNEPGMMNGGSDIVTVQGGNGNYNAHVERDGEISDREIRFDKPKTVYRPGEQITLNITNDKAKTKNTKDGIVYGVVDFSTAQPGQSTDYPAMDKHPGYNSGKVKGTATGVAPQSGKPGVVDFSITEQIMVKGSYTKTHTTYYYVWEE